MFLTSRKVVSGFYVPFYIIVMTFGMAYILFFEVNDIEYLVFLFTGFTINQNQTNGLKHNLKIIKIFKACFPFVVAPVKYLTCLGVLSQFLLATSVSLYSNDVFEGASFT